MFKKSFYVLLIECFGVLLSLVSLFLITATMDPAVYSLLGVSSVMSGIILTFSDLGIETAMGREALYWIEHDEYERVREYTTQALLSRMLGCTVLIPGLTVYLLYMSRSKYDGQYVGLLFLFLFNAVISSLNDAMSLITKAHGRYVLSRMLSMINSYFIKFVGIILYYWKGTDVYLAFCSLASLPLFMIFLWIVRKDFSIRYVKPRQTIRKIIDSRYLWLRTDLDYFKGSADSMLVSLLFPASVMGSYSVYKHFESLSKSLIEGFFDVLTQELVRYKGQPDVLIEKEKKIKRARNIAIVMIGAGTAIYLLNPKFFVGLLHLTRYEYIDVMILFAALVSVTHLFGKYEINLLGLFAPSRMIFLISIILFAGTVISFGLVKIFPDIHGIMYQRLFVFLFTSLVNIMVFRRDKKDYYVKIYR